MLSLKGAEMEREGWNCMVERMALLQKGYALNRGRLWNRLEVEVIHLKRYRTCLDRTEDISR
jgi:hypothetical protein